MDAKEYDVFISVGVPDGIEFEETFMANNPKLFGIIVDGTREVVCKNKKLMHFKQNLSPVKSLRTNNLQDFFKNFKNIYLKMNVKGYENEYFKSLTQEQISKIKVLHIENHQDEDMSVIKCFQSSHNLSKTEPFEKYGKNSKGNWRVVNYIFVKKT
jgi:hypothetical protein